MSLYKCSLLLLCPWFCFAQVFVDNICDRPELHNGRLYSDINFPARRKADLWYTCNDNFVEVHRQYDYWERRYYGHSKCTEYGWHPMPKCVGQSCGPPPVVQFGETLENRELTNEHGTVMNYKCLEYYILEGSKEVMCRNGKWDDPPICIGQSCGLPPVVQFGETLENRKLTNKHGSVMNYKCPEYYILEGNKEVVCRNGTWDDPPICIEPCTVTERDLTANNIQLRWLDEKKFYSHHNEWIGFSCLYGYEISDEKLLRIQCNRGKLTYPKCIKIGSCLLSLTTMDEMHIFVNGSTEIETGKTVNFLCKEGWIPKDTLTQVCNNRNIKYPTCRSTDSCQISQEQLDRNALELDSKDKDSVYFEDGERIQFKCRTGFTITTGTVGLCRKTHITYPKCTDSDICRLCHTQLDENGLELDSKDIVYFEDGELIQFKCKTGFTISTGTVGLCAKTQITYPKCTKK